MGIVGMCAWEGESIKVEMLQRQTLASRIQINNLKRFNLNIPREKGKEK